MSRRPKSRREEHTDRKADRPSLASRIRIRFPRAFLIAGVALVSASLAVAVLAFLILSGGGDPSTPKTAVIVDQLSLTASNPEFAKEATETLEDAGYTVDYFPGEEVTVDFYRDLATQGYDFIILRAHSARLQQEFEGQTIDEVILFTTEAYSDTKYVQEQEAGALAIARYYEGADPIFGIAPDFIRSSMKGSFEGATIVLMGCEGLGSEETAQSFVEKGAETIISWSGLVSASHTDAATDDLLKLLLDEELPPAEAVAATMEGVGPDPTYGSELRLLQ